MKKKIAILAKGDLKDQKGMFNAVIARIKHLKKISSDYDIDSYMMVTYDPWYIRLLRKTPKEEQIKSITINGVDLKLLWRPFSFVDYVLRTKFHKPEIFESAYLKKLVHNFKGYDLIDAHSTSAGMVAYLAKRKYCIPYLVTWHGSDIHMGPFTKTWTKTRKEIIELSDMNLFVSQKLLQQSEWISRTPNKTVLYNGCDEKFKIYSEETRQNLRKKYGIEGKKVVAFSGLFRKVKNTTSLPGIFDRVNKSCENACFWFIGDGAYRKPVEQACNEKELDCKFFGNMPPCSMPELMNCVDVLILPSFNEGLPLVVVEALKSGCFAVGSRAGGIPEVIGDENSFELDDNFEVNISARIIAYLNNEVSEQQQLSSNFDWNHSAQKELSIIDSIIGVKIYESMYYI